MRIADRHTVDAFVGGQAQDRRGFWTRRKRTATSLCCVVALIAGVAIAFKTFDQTVGNNTVRDASNFQYAVDVYRPADPAPTDWLPVGASRPIFPMATDGSIDQFPGDVRTERVRIRNTNAPARDATFRVYADQIQVWDCTIDPASPAPWNCSSIHLIPASNPNHARFLSLWRLKIDRERVLQLLGAPELNENDHALPDLSQRGEHDASGNSQREVVCDAALTAITRLAPCSLGTIRGAGSTEVIPELGLQPTDTRWYSFSLAETDSETDQSEFKGWLVFFRLVFQAQVPAVADEPGLINER